MAMKEIESTVSSIFKDLVPSPLSAAASSASSSSTTATTTTTTTGANSLSLMRLFGHVESASDGPPPRTTTIYECMDDSERYVPQRPEPVGRPFALVQLIRRLDPALLQQPSPKTETTLDEYARLLTDLKQRIVKENAPGNRNNASRTSEEQRQKTMNILRYLCHLRALLPLVSTLPLPFSFYVRKGPCGDATADDAGDTTTTVKLEETALHFEYLAMLWYLVTQFFIDADDNSPQAQLKMASIGTENQEEFHRRLVPLDLCIDIVRHMQQVESQRELVEPGTVRLAYIQSPSSISNSDGLAYDTLAPRDAEREQREDERQLMEHYFGGSQSMEVRVSLLKAKKYEFYFVRLQRALHPETLFDYRTYGLTISDDDDDTDENEASDRIEHATSLAGFAIQITRHYHTAYTKCRETSESDTLIEYLQGKRVYWKSLAFFMQAIVDYHLYVKSRHMQQATRIEQSKRALKRIEEARRLLTTLESTQEGSSSSSGDEKKKKNTKKTTKRRKQSTDEHSLSGQLSALAKAVEVLYQLIHREVTVTLYRKSDGVQLAAIPEVLPESTPNGESRFIDQLDTTMEEIRANSGVVRDALKLLASMQRRHQLDAGGSERYRDGDGDDDDEEVDEQQGGDVEVIDVEEARLQMAVVYERKRWLDYLVKNTRQDRAGNAFIVIKDYALIAAAKEETDRLIETNDPDGTLRGGSGGGDDAGTEGALSNKLWTLSL
jgi:hypothetical protein